MPRKNLLAKKKEKLYTEEQVELAVVKVQSGEFSLNKSAKTFGIPVATLHRRVHGIGETIGSGSSTRLSKQLESVLVDTLIKLSNWGFGRTYNNVIALVTDYLQHQGQSHLFPNGIPGRDWYNLFLNRWSHRLSIRAIGNISSLRAASCTQEVVAKYFKTLQREFNVACINVNTPRNLWNFDEIGFSGDQDKQNIVCRRGAKRPLKSVGDNEKIHYSVGNCINAAGNRLAPYIIFKSKKRLYRDWCLSGPDDAIYAVSPSGWMEDKQFVQWLTNVYVPAIKKIPGIHILVVDRHLTQVTYRVVLTCIENNIVLICLPAHSSHILQPLDVGVYCHVKRVWRKLLQQFYAETKFSNLSKECFSHLQKKLFSSGEVFTRNQIVTGFQNTGLFPLDINKIDQSKFQTANTFETPTSEHEAQTELSLSQQPKSMIVKSPILAPQTTLSQPLPSESPPTSSICHIASAPKSPQNSPCLQTTFNIVVTPAFQKEMQKESEKQLQSDQSLAEALQQIIHIQHVDAKKRKNVDEILKRLKETGSEKAAKQAKKTTLT